MRQVFLIILFVLVFAAGHEGLHVHGPLAPVVAHVGAPVLLSCFIESPLPLEDLQVEWRKMDSDSLVIVFQQGKNRPDLQSQEFRDRVNFFRDKVSKGNFSVLLRNVGEEDAGGYRCQINTTQYSSEVIMEIKVISKHFVVTGANHTVFAYKGEDVILNCSVDSHVAVSKVEEVTWRKKDREGDMLVLLYQDGEIFQESSHEIYKDRVDLFSSEISKGNFSLKLMDVRMEDKGEFVCEVYTSHMSTRTSVVLQGVGFSALHILILVLCVIALLLAVGFSGPVYKLLKQKDSTQKAMKIHLSLILCPNICMFVAFCLWSTEGFLFMIVPCSTVSIMRPIMLLKTSPYFDRLPKFLQNTVKNLAVPLYYSSIVISACSNIFGIQIETIHEKIKTILTVCTLVLVIIAVVLAVYGFRIHVTVCLEIINSLLIAVSGIGSTFHVKYDYEIPMVVPPLNTGILMALSLQRHLFLGKTFKCVHITLSSICLISFCIYQIFIYTILSVTLGKGFETVPVLCPVIPGWILLFEVVVFIFAWVAIIYTLRCHRGHGQGCCSQWRKIGYFISIAIAVILITAYGTVSFHYVYIISQSKDRAGYLALTPLVHVLAAACLFKHPEHLPDFLHSVVYMFGAVGLSIVNAIALAVELILKAGKGAGTIGDLRVIVLSFETVFVFAWLVLQIYTACVRFKDRSKQVFKDEKTTEPENVPEMEVLSAQTDLQ